VAGMKARGIVLGVVGLAILMVAVAAMALRWTNTSGDAADAGAGSVSGASDVPDAVPPSEDPCLAGSLVLGSLLPLTGDQAFLGPPAAAAVSLALAEINAAGGVLGSQVRVVSGDSGGAGSSLAPAAVADQLAGGAQVVIGALSSAVTLEVIDQVTAAGVAMISPANTTPALTTYPDEGLYFRVVPSDALQGTVLAGVAREGGFARPATVARADAFGLGIQEAFDTAFVAQGGAPPVSVQYSPTAVVYADAVSSVASANPDAVVVIGFDETAAIIKEMTRQGIGPRDVQVLVAEGGVSTSLYAELPRGDMVGVLGSVPVLGPVVGRKAFHQRLLDVDPALTTFAYGAETYDAVILAALAAESAGCAEGERIAAAVPDVANANPGSDVCGTFADCLEIIGRGGQPNYEGVVGPLELDTSGQPSAGSVEVVRFVTNTRYVRVDVVDAP
jgi:branched-chain amino acid transport system substrate-binding protein